MVWLWRLVRVTLCVQVALTCWGTYRRLWQVQHIEVVAPSAALAPGSTVGYDVVTSGETHNLIRLELVQADLRVTLIEQRAGVNRINTYDPRLLRSTPSVTLGSERLRRFHAGPAVLRLTVFGGMKLLRTPPPRVEELAVRIAPLGS